LTTTPNTVYKITVYPKILIKKKKLEKITLWHDKCRNFLDFLLSKDIYI